MQYFVCLSVIKYPVYITNGSLPCLPLLFCFTSVLFWFLWVFYVKPYLFNLFVYSHKRFLRYVRLLRLPQYEGKVHYLGTYPHSYSSVDLSSYPSFCRDFDPSSYRSICPSIHLHSLDRYKNRYIDLCLLLHVLFPTCMYYVSDVYVDLAVCIITYLYFDGLDHGIPDSNVLLTSIRSSIFSRSSSLSYLDIVCMSNETVQKTKIIWTD